MGTICINLTIPKVDKIRNVKQVSWNIRAPEEKWVEFKRELDKRCNRASNIILDKNLEINHRYAKWFNEIDTAARSTIGKTTFRTHTMKKPSKEAKELRKSKRELMHEIRNEKDEDNKLLLIQKHKDL